MHASALKFDATFDPAQLPVATPGTNTFAFFVAVIQVRALDATTGSGYFQGKPSYDSFTVQDASGNVISQPNYDAGQYNPSDTTDYPPGSKVTVSVTLDFTKDRPNAAGGGPNPTTPDLSDPPTWKTYHDTMVSDYNTNGAATDFSNIHLLFDTGNGFMLPAYTSIIFG